jgi:hypothetical protein
MTEPNEPGLSEAADPEAAARRAELRRLTQGYTATQLIYAAAKLGLPDLLAEGPASGELLAQRIGVVPDRLTRVLRGLATLGIVAHDDDDRFSLTPLGEGLRRDAPGSMQTFALLSGEERYAAWGQLMHTIMTGEPAFERVFDMPMFTFYQSHPDASSRFNERMVLVTTENARAVAQAYDFSCFEHIVDIGGGRGVLLATVLRAYPSLRGTVFDLPHLVEEAGAFLAQAGVDGRSNVEEGDFFVSVTAGADCYLLSMIIHDWDDEDALRILTRCCEAMHSGSRLLLLEVLSPERVKGPDYRVDLDLLMMVLLDGRERTESQYRALIERAGLTYLGVIPINSSSGATLIEAMKE